MRINVGGERKKICSARKSDPPSWLDDAECSNGKGEIRKELNTHLSILKLKVFDERRVLLKNNKEVTAEALKNLLTGKEEKGRMVLEIFQRHNDQMKGLVNSDFASGTFILVCGL